MGTRSIAGLFLSLLCLSANAATLTAVNRGYYSDGSFLAPGSGNYLVGDFYFANSDEVRNFFVYNLASVTDAVTAATLHLYNPSALDPRPLTGDGYRSPDPSETYTVFDVTTPVGELTGGTGSPASTFADLGSGTVLGSVIATAASNGTFIDIALNSSGLAYLNAHLGSLVAFGGALTTLGAIGPPHQEPPLEILFGRNRAGVMSDTQLLTAVPIPPAVWLFGSALGLIGVMRRKLSS